jgi:hypothetical protein
MDRERFAEATERLQEVDRFVRTLDPAVRAEAFSLRRRYALERKSTIRGGAHGALVDATGGPGTARPGRLTPSPFAAAVPA